MRRSRVIQVRIGVYKAHFITPGVSRMRARIEPRGAADGRRVPACSSIDSKSNGPNTLPDFQYEVCVLFVLVISCQFVNYMLSMATDECRTGRGVRK